MLTVPEHREKHMIRAIFVSAVRDTWARPGHLPNFPMQAVWTGAGRE